MQALGDDLGNVPLKLGNFPNFLIDPIHLSITVDIKRFTELTDHVS